MNDVIDNPADCELKDFLGGTCFGSDEKLKKTVNTWLNELAAEEYNTGILKLVNRYDKCLNYFYYHRYYYYDYFYYYYYYYYYNYKYYHCHYY
ncbi:hypothetical protein ANN_03763 [Periplaneta americana]|uniref:Uncharacterized protein n=1 Tax=Periplaneta americana TaxID=6978 RepID=A0ABQ8TZX8_PERAM|nr:hypothetical protein ANN_03763 [Periplaneta americana]